MNTEMIAKTEVFLKDTFAASSYLQANPTDRDYRLEHSYRVANIAKTIAGAEGFDVTYAVIGGLLHDIAYCEEMKTYEDRANHGHRSAEIARPFLESLGLNPDAVNEICCRAFAADRKACMTADKVLPWKRLNAFEQLFEAARFKPAHHQQHAVRAAQPEIGAHGVLQ